MIDSEFGIHRSDSRRRRTWLRALSLLGATCLALTTVSCSSGASAQAPLPAKNMSTWTMPLDGYVYTYVSLSEYAENLLTKPCMTQHGYSYPVPWRNPDRLDTLRRPGKNDVGARLFTTSIAKKWGYHLPPRTNSNYLAAMAAMRSLRGISKEEDAVLTDCIAKARKRLPLLAPEAQRAALLENQARQEALEKSEVTQAAAKWRSCMAPAGVSDLPEKPSDMPSRSLVRRFDIGAGGGPARPKKASTSSPDADGDDPASTPLSVSPAEIAIATRDAECRVSSGYKKRLYDAEWGIQVGMLHDNADMLHRIKKELETHKKQVMKVVLKNAPSR